MYISICDQAFVHISHNVATGPVRTSAPWSAYDEMWEHQRQHHCQYVRFTQAPTSPADANKRKTGPVRVRSAHSRLCCAHNADRTTLLPTYRVRVLYALHAICTGTWCVRWSYYPFGHHFHGTLKCAACALNTMARMSTNPWLLSSHGWLCTILATSWKSSVM